MATRHPTHEYADEPLDNETLRTIFESVVQAPSSYDLQPWEFVTLHEDEIQQLLREVTYD